MKKNIFNYAVAFTALILNVFLSNAKDKEDVIITPDISGRYTTVYVNGDFKVEYRPSADALQIVVKENIADLVECSVVNDTLRINFASGKGAKAILSAKAPVIYLPHRAEVTKVQLAGAARMESEVDIKAENLEFKLSGAARLIAPIDIDNLTVYCAGTSNVTLTGRVDYFKIRIDGASRIAACEGFECRFADLEINGTGIVRINCIDTLTGKASGVSMVRYLTEPKILNIKSNGVNAVAKIKQ